MSPLQTRVFTMHRKRATRCASRRQLRVFTTRALPFLEPLENRSVPALGMTAIDIPNAGPLVNLAVGLDGNLWTGGLDSPATIERVSLNGVVTSYPVPDQNSLGSLIDLTRGGDGNIWFSDWTSIGKITPQGKVTLYPLPQDKGTDTGLATALAAGPDGNVWFLERYTSEV